MGRNEAATTSATYSQIRSDVLNQDNVFTYMNPLSKKRRTYYKNIVAFPFHSEEKRFS